jgi:hypothetical protein
MKIPRMWMRQLVNLSHASAFLATLPRASTLGGGFHTVADYSEHGAMGLATIVRHNPLPKKALRNSTLNRQTACSRGTWLSGTDWP